jgi:hypothetical protein
MPRYMLTGAYSEAGASGVLSQGFAARTEQLRGLVAQWGGTLEGIYFSSNGQTITIVSYEGPQNNALSVLQGMASGAWLTNIETQELYTGEEMDAALAQQTVAYRPPGSEPDDVVR